jgi:hypothetical protein
MKIRLVGAEFFHVDGNTDGQTESQTDVKKANRRFSQFCEKRLIKNTVNEIFVIK